VSGWIFRIQRYSAIALVPFILAHLATILLVGTADLTAEQLLTRTHGSVGWAAFYGVFVLLISLHGSIGLWRLRSSLESLSDRISGVIAGSAAGLLAVSFGVLTIALGLRAVFGLYGAVLPG